MDTEVITYAPEETVIKCGKLFVELNGGGFGKITLDGVNLSVLSMTFTAKAGEQPTVTFTTPCE